MRSWLLGLLILTQCAAADKPTFLVGTAIGNITPTIASLESGEYYLGGYGFWKDRGPAMGVHDPLSVRALCIEATNSVCLVVADSLGFPAPLVQEIRQRAAFKAGIPADRILISTTHTHAAPDLLGLWGGAPANYRRKVIEETASAVASAYHGRVAASLSYQLTRGDAHNRRGWGRTDDQLALLMIRDPEYSTLLGAAVFFAAHPVITPASNRDISSDFVHAIREKLATELKAPILFFNGAMGDVNPPESTMDDYWLASTRYGHALADQALSIAARPIQLTAQLSFKRQSVSLPVDNTTLNIANLLGLLAGDLEGFWWNRQVNADVHHVTLGNQLELLTLPGEAMTRFAESLRALSQRDTILIGQTNDSLGYIIPEDEWYIGRNNNYEESVSLGPETAPRLIQAIRELLAQ